VNPTNWGLIISGMTALGAVIGVVMSRIGKKGDQELQSFTDQYERMLGENKYLTEQLKSEREGRASDRTDAEARWTRQMERCRRVTDAASDTITRLLSSRGPDPAAQAALDQIVAHNDAVDHDV
jgi:hypothetical protein